MCTHIFSPFFPWGGGDGFNWTWTSRRLTAASWRFRRHLLVAGPYPSPHMVTAVQHGWTDRGQQCFRSNIYNPQNEVSPSSFVIIMSLGCRCLLPSAVFGSCLYWTDDDDDDEISFRVYAVDCIKLISLFPYQFPLLLLLASVVVQCNLFSL